MSLGTLLEKLFIAVRADLSGLSSELDRGAKDVETKTQKMTKSFDKVGRSMQRVGGTLTKAVTLPIAGLAAATVKVASDAEEMQSMFAAVFKEQASDVERWADTQARALNRSRFDLMEYAANFQDTFVPLGFARDDAAEFSKQLTILGEDLASFKNLNTEEVMRSLQSAIVGNHESVRKFGVVINQTNLKQELLNMGLEGGMKAATEQQKAMARLNIIMAGTADAQGDAERTSTSFANQMKGMTSQLREVGVTVGTILIPPLAVMLEHLNDALKWFNTLSPEVQKFSVIMVGLGAAIGPVLIVLGFVATAIAAIGFPITLTVAAIATLVTAFIVFKDDIFAAVNAAKDAVFNAFESMKQSVIDLYNTIQTYLIDKLNAVWDVITSKIEWVEGKFRWLYDKVAGDSWIPDMVDNISTEFARLQKEMVDPTKRAAEETNSVFSGLMDSVSHSLSQFIETGKFSFKEFVDDVVGGILDDAMRGFTEALSTLVQDFVSGLFSSIGSGFSGTGGSGLFGQLGGMLKGLFGNIFGGFKAGGGVVPPWKSFIAGEQGPELVEQSGVGGARRVSSAGSTRGRMMSAAVAAGGTTIVQPRMEVEIINTTGQPVTQDSTTRRGDDVFRKIIIGTVSEAQVGGQLDGSMRARTGARPLKMRR